VTQASTAWRILKSLLPSRGVSRLAPRDAYRLWSATYDEQPDNVVLRLESKLFADLLEGITLEDKVVLDVGCGTGRHWSELLARRPSRLDGADSSSEMLERLRAKFPSSALHLVADWELPTFAEASVDAVISTLTIGHIRELGRAIKEWSRVLTPGGPVIVTDFHPEAFRIGLKRTFVHQGQTIEAENHLHPVAELRSLFQASGLVVRSVAEGIIDDTVKPLFERQGRMNDYRRYTGTPIVVGFQLERTSGTGRDISG